MKIAAARNNGCCSGEDWCGGDLRWCLGLKDEGRRRGKEMKCISHSPKVQKGKETGKPKAEIHHPWYRDSNQISKQRSMEIEEALKGIWD